MSDSSNANQNDHDLSIQIKVAADARDVAALVALLDPLPLSEARCSGRSDRRSG